MTFIPIPRTDHRVALALTARVESRPPFAEVQFL